jgi:hypothetical protein
MQFAEMTGGLVGRTPFEHLINLGVECLDGGGIRLGDRQSLVRGAGSGRRRRGSRIVGGARGVRRFREVSLQFIDLFLQIINSRFHGFEVGTGRNNHQEGKDENLRHSFMPIHSYQGTSGPHSGLTAPLV